MRTHFTATLLGLCLAAPALQAADAPLPARELLQPPAVEIPSPLTDRFAMRGIYSFDQVSTQVRYDGSTGVRGTDFFAEDLLGLDDKRSTGSLELLFRLGERNHLRVDYFKLTRHGDVVLDQQVAIGNNNYFVGDRVLTDLDVRTLGLTYTYSFLKTDKYELGGGLGVQLGQVDAAMQVPARRLRDTADGVAPLPSLALDGSWLFAERFSLNGRVQYLVVHTNGNDGSFFNYHVDVQYRAWKNLAAGLGYTKMRLLDNNTDPANSGRLDFQVKGPELFLRVSF